MDGGCARTVIRKKLFSVSLLLSIFFIFAANPVLAKGWDEGRTLVLKDGLQFEDLYEGLMMLSDDDRELAVSDVVSGKYDHLFFTPEEFPTKPGFFPIAKWIKFQVFNDSSTNDWLLEFAFPLIYQIHMYEVTDSGYKKLITSGAEYPFKQREFDHRNFVFNLDIEPQETKTYYAVLHGGADLHPAINIWAKDSFIEHTQQEYIILGLFYGILVIMIVYNLFLYISLRMKAYLYYVLLIITSMIAQLSLNGLAFEYIWPELPAWNKQAVSFWVGISCILIILFTKEFLDTNKHIPGFRLFSFVLIGFNLLMMSFLYIDHYIALNLMLVSTFLTFSSAIGVTVLSLRRGVREARFLILGWTIFLGGVFITILQRTAMIPHSVFSEYAGQGALALQIALLSIALADKINIMRQEKSEAERLARESQELALQSLKKADELKDEFLAITSHELKTPLYGMIGIAESLKEGAAGKISKEMFRQLEMIILSGRRLSQLVNEILDFSMLKYETINLDLKRVNLYRLVDIVFTVCRPLLNNKDVKLINKVNKEDYVLADVNRLQQILYNLVGNAIEFTDFGKVSVSTVRKDDQITICVKDTGRGIGELKLEEIFEPFKQIDSSVSRTIGGTGIGLNITKQLVELHGGYLQVESKLGVGSTFSFTLQAAEKSVETSMAEIVATVNPMMDKRPSTVPPKVFSKNTGFKVLIVDDEPVNLQVLMNQLTLAGIDVVETSKGEEVFSLVEQYTFDVVILDVMMPNISGYEVCERLRKKYSLVELPILMLTAKNQVHEKTTAFEVGANDYLTKPCEKEELLARVKTLAQMRRLNSELQQLNIRLEDLVKERTSALQKANEDLSLSNNQLLEVAESRRNLLSNIAHELGTPVTLIHSYVQSLQEGLIKRDDEFYRRVVDDKINVLSRLIDDLFELSKLEAGSTSLNLVRKDLFEWLRNSRRKFEIDVQTFNRRFEVNEISFVQNMYHCTVDKERMDQVFLNIISNAVKNTSEKDGKISVKVEISSKEDYVTISFKDNGKGISKDMLPYIFDRFYKKTYSKEEKFTGTGLGLAIVKEIVKGHNGKIWAESEVGVGSTFYISLPIERVYENYQEEAQ